MGSKLVLLCLAVLCATGSTFAQSPLRTKPRLAHLPLENVLLTTAVQPDCPVEIYEPTFMYDVDENRLAVMHRLRNRGSKPLRLKDYTIAAWYSEGGGWTSGIRVEVDTLLPGQTTESSVQFEEVPLTEALRNKLELRKGMRQVVVLLIESIQYADGSAYNQKALSEALMSYFARGDGSTSSKGKQTVPVAANGSGPKFESAGPQ